MEYPPSPLFRAPDRLIGLTSANFQEMAPVVWPGIVHKASCCPETSRSHETREKENVRRRGEVVALCFAVCELDAEHAGTTKM